MSGTQSTTTNGVEPLSRREAAARYIRENFRPDDRIAVVLLDRRSGGAVQRVAAAKKIADESFQAWLRHMNARGWEVYVGMNALRPEAAGPHQGRRGRSAPRLPRPR